MKTVQVGFRCTPELKEEISELARAQRSSLDETIERIMFEHKNSDTSFASLLYQSLFMRWGRLVEHIAELKAWPVEKVRDLAAIQIRQNHSAEFQSLCGTVGNFVYSDKWVDDRVYSYLQAALDELEFSVTPPEGELQRIRELISEVTELAAKLGVEPELGFVGELEEEAKRLRHQLEANSKGEK